MPTKISVSVSLDAGLLNDIDDRSSELGFGSRSEYLRDLIRDDLPEHEARQESPDSKPEEGAA